MAAPRAARLRQRLGSARRVSDSAQRSFLASEDRHAELAEREERRTERERQVETPNADRFPSLGGRQS